MLKKRYLEELIPKVEEIEQMDEEWRALLKELNSLRAERNKVSKEIGRMYREGNTKDAEQLKKKAAELDNKITELERKEAVLKKLIDENLRYLPNFIHPEVVVGPDDSHNKPIKFWGTPKVWTKYIDSFRKETNGFNVEYERMCSPPPHHYDLVKMLDVADVERAGKTSGSRFYYEKKGLVFLDLALARWALEELMSKGFEPVIPPYMTRRRVEEAATYFTDFEDVIYKVEGEDLYLIPTAEHPLLGYHMDEIFEVGELPKRYAGWSPCFRKEAGAHGKDTKGIFRVHQFHKVEQFSYVYPEESWGEFEFLRNNAEELLQKLELPYRVVEIASGDLGMAAARKHDIEVWFPGQGRYREVTSCSNCLSWQARRANIRYRKKDGKTDYVHTLNSTAIASQRVMLAILENHYCAEENVVKIPKTLHPYLPKEFREIGIKKKEE